MDWPAKMPKILLLSANLASQFNTNLSKMYLDLVKKVHEFAEGEASKDERAALKGNRCRKRDGGTYLDFESLKIPPGCPGGAR